MPVDVGGWEANVRANLRDIRRQELIDATITAIAAHGLPDTTLATVAQAAGMSPGLVNHYFDGKDDLLEATLRRLTSDLAREIADRRPPGAGPRERLDAIIDGCLDPRALHPGAMIAWNAFWSQIPSKPRFARLQRTVNRRFRSNIRVALRALLPPERVEDVYLGLYALIDGFWIRQFIDPGSFSINDARRICRRYIEDAIAAR